MSELDEGCVTETQKGTQKEDDSDGENFLTMETRGQTDVTLFPDIPVKVKQEECEPSETDDFDNIPRVSSLPVAAVSNVNSEVFFYPTQAVLAPTSAFSLALGSVQINPRSAQRIAQKRKTILTLAQGAMLNVENPFMFTETMLEAKREISVFDNKTKQKVARDVLSNRAVGVRTNIENFPKIGDCYSLQNENQSASRPSGEQTSSVTPPSVTATAVCHATTMAKSVTTVTATGQRSPGVEASNTAALDTPNSRPDQGQGSPVSETTVNVSRPASCNDKKEEQRTTERTSFRPVSTKMAICLPNCASTTSQGPSPSGIYVPKEISMVSGELALSECISVKDICDKELTKWTTEDVAKFIRATDCSDYADAFVDQEIDGKALTLLNQDLLIQWMKLKLGPAMKLYRHVRNLKNALQNQSQI